MMNPNDINMKDIYNVFFDTMFGVARMRYLNPKPWHMSMKGGKAD